MRVWIMITSGGRNALGKRQPASAAGLLMAALVCTCTLSLFPSWSMADVNATESFTSETVGQNASLVREAAVCKCRKVQENHVRNVKVCSCKNEPFLTIPQHLDSNLQILQIEGGGIERLDGASFRAYGSTLEELHISKAPNFSAIKSGSFDNLLYITTVIISNVPALKTISADVFDVFLPKLHFISFTYTGIVHIPSFNIRLKAGNTLHSMFLNDNQIIKLSSFTFKIDVAELLLEYNQIAEVENLAFSGSKIGKLSLKGNKRLTILHENTFSGLLNLNELDLSSTSITLLPTSGLKELSLTSLNLQHVHSLHVFPSVYDFRRLSQVRLTYHYHCCAFRYPNIHDPRGFQENRVKELTCSTGPRRPARSFFDNGSFGDFPTNPPGTAGPNAGPIAPSNGNGTFHPTSVNVSDKVVSCGQFAPNFHEVKCWPEPDAFNPCEDLMGYMGLRVAVWLVVVAAVVGNFLVIVVLMSTRFKMTVSKFLMCNLAFADFCMGLYLFMLAAMDVHSSGQYFNYAILWQTGAGCKVAGFLTVFASELSIFTLTLITMERWYAINYAIHLNKRLRLGTAVKVMVLGWFYALVFATLPLLGISDYQKTSICLPFAIAKPIDLAYVLSLLTINGLAFLLICGCYGKMYWTISAHRSTVAHNDKTVAQRMALLVFTDFACWAPIAFFGLTALAGYPLIDVTNSKILLVCFYPLNSCANPFLYAIFTKQFGRDLGVLLNRYGLFKERSSTNKSNLYNRQVASLSVTNVTNNVCMRNRTCINNGGMHGTHFGTVGGTMGTNRRVSLATQESTVIDNHVRNAEKNAEEDSVNLTTRYEALQKDEDSSENSLPPTYDYIMSNEDEHSPSKHKGSPHPIVKNNCAKFVLSAPPPERNCGLVPELNCWESWNGRRSASLGGCVQEIVPLKLQAVTESACKSAI